MTLSESDLASALTGGELVLHYQPIVEVRSGACVRVETLLRWQHPRFGQILPGGFLHLAEPALRNAIDLWVLRAALRQRSEWQSHGERLGVAVNLTSYDDEQVAAIVTTMYGVETGAVNFELRAAGLHGGTSDPAPALVRLAATGAGVTVDDLTLADVPPRALASAIDEIKIARSLVTRAAVDRRARDELGALVEFARDHGLRVITVGVEDRSTYELISALRCDMAQGYWVSRPLVPDRLQPARRWAAGLAFTGVVAFGAHAGAGKVAASGGRAIEQTLTQAGLFSSGCCLDVPARGSGVQLAAQDKLEQARARTGLPFAGRSSARADMFVQSSVVGSVADTLARTVDRDIADLEEEFGRVFESRPSIYVFATRANFALGLQQLFGVRGPDAGILAAANGGITLTKQGAIAINLQNVSVRDLAIVRHELTHAMINQIIDGGSIPTWVHEGIATLQERHQIADEFTAARSAARALSVLSAGRTGLADLEPASEWLQRNAALEGNAYAVSAEAVRVLTQRVSSDGLIRILEDVGRGSTFGAAFATEAGESLGDFERAYPARLAADLSTARIVHAPSTDGVRWSIAGFTPNRPVTISIEGASYKVQFEVVADGLGMYDAVFGATAPKGEYTLRASSDRTEATATLRT